MFTQCGKVVKGEQIKWKRHLLRLNGNHYTIDLDGRGTENIRVTLVSDGKHGHAEKFTASGSKITIVSSIMMDSALRQHSIVLNL
jgi:hypothetical protein